MSTSSHCHTRDTTTGTSIVDCDRSTSPPLVLVAPVLPVMSSPTGAMMMDERPPAPPALCIGDSEPPTPIGHDADAPTSARAHGHGHMTSAAAAVAAAAASAVAAGPRRPPIVPSNVTAALPPLAGLPSGRAATMASASRPSSPASVPVSAQLHAAAPSPFAAARGAAMLLHSLHLQATSSSAEGSGSGSAPTAMAAASAGEGEAPASDSALPPLAASAAVLDELRGASQAHGPLSSRLKHVSGRSGSLASADPLRALGDLYSNDESLAASTAGHHIRFCHSTHAAPKLASRAHYFATDGSVPVLFHDIRMVSSERLVLPVVLCAYTETAAEIRATLMDIAAMQSDMQSAGWPVELHVALVMDGWFRAPHSTKQYVRKLFQTPREQTTAAADLGARAAPTVQYEDILSEWCSDSEDRPPSTVNTLIVQKISSAPVGMSNPLPGTADPQPLFAILPVDVAGDANNPNAQSKRLKLTLIIKRDNRRKHNSHEWFLRSFAPSYATTDAEHGHKLAFMTDSGTKFDPKCLRKLVEYMHSQPSCSAASGYQRAMPEWMQQYDVTTPPSLWTRLFSGVPSLSLDSVRGSLYRAAQKFEYESSMNAFSSAFHMSGQLQVLPGPCQLIRLDLIVRETPANVRMRLVAEKNQHWRNQLRALHQQQTSVLKKAFQIIQAQLARIQRDSSFSQFLDSSLQMPGQQSSSCSALWSPPCVSVADRSRFHTQLLSLEHTVDRQLELLQLLYLDLPHPLEFELDAVLSSEEQCAYFSDLYVQLERECEVLRVDLAACSGAANRLERVVAAMDSRAAQPLAVQKSMRAEADHALFDSCMEALHRVLLRESTRLLRWLERFDPTRHAQMAAHPVDLLAHAIAVQSLDSERREVHEEQRFRAQLRRARDPADYYFICMARSPEDAGLLLGNLQLAEDRVFSYACVLHVRQHVHTAFVPNALFFFPVETEAESSIQQIRRWSNGTVAGFLFLFQYRDTFLKQLGWSAWRRSDDWTSGAPRGGSSGAASAALYDYASEQPYSTRAFDRERRNMMDLLDSSLRSVSAGTANAAAVAALASPSSTNKQLQQLRADSSDARIFASPRQRRIGHTEVDAQLASGQQQHKTSGALAAAFIQPLSPSVSPPLPPQQQAEMSLLFYRKDLADADRLHAHSSVRTGLFQQVQLAAFLILTALQLSMSVCVAVSPSVWFLALYFSLPEVLPSEGLYDQWAVLAYIALYALFVHLHAHPGRIRLHTSLFHVLTVLNMIVAAVPAYAAIHYFVNNCGSTMNPLTDWSTDCRWIGLTAICVFGIPFLLAVLHDIYTLLPALERVPLKENARRQHDTDSASGGTVTEAAPVRRLSFLPLLSVRIRWEWAGTPSSVTMLFSLIPFYLYLPTRGSYLTSYAYSRVWELTWGSKPSDPSGPQAGASGSAAAAHAARVWAMRQSASVLAYSLLALNIGIFLIGCQLSEFRGVLSGFAALLLCPIVLQMVVSAVWLVYKLTVAPVLRVATEIARMTVSACKPRKQMYTSAPGPAPQRAKQNPDDHHDTLQMV